MQDAVHRGGGEQCAHQTSRWLICRATRAVWRKQITDGCGIHNPSATHRQLGSDI